MLRLYARLIALVLLMVPFAGRSETLLTHNNRLFIPIVINGTRAEALLDSAAEMTFVDRAFAQSLGLRPEGEATAKGSGGEAQVRFAKNVKVAAIGVDLANLTVALIDMTDLSQRLVGRSVQVILGREIFDAARIEIDIEGHSIRSLKRTTEPRGIRLALTSERGVESVPCLVEGVPTQADIDLGNGSEVMIGKTFAEKLSVLTPARIVERKSGGGIGGAIERDILVLNHLELAGVRFDEVRAAVDAQPTAGPVNVGTSILRRFIIVLDYAERAAWFDQTASNDR